MLGDGGYASKKQKPLAGLLDAELAAAIAKEILFG